MPRKRPSSARHRRRATTPTRRQSARDGSASPCSRSRALRFAGSLRIFALTPPRYVAALLHALARVEADGFAALGELGARPPRAARVFTAGGGAKNEFWRDVRARAFNALPGGDGASATEVFNLEAPRADACYGAALLGLGAAVGSPSWEDAQRGTAAAAAA